MQTTQHEVEDVFGNRRIETRDKDGKLIAVSEQKTNVFGEVYYDTYDTNNQFLGTGKVKTDIWGNQYIEISDKAGNFIQTVREKTDTFGNVYFEIFDASGEQVGESKKKTDFWVNSFTETTTKTDSDTSNQTSGSQKIVSSGGGPLEIIGTIILTILPLFLFYALRDAAFMHKARAVMGVLMLAVGAALLVRRYLAMSERERGAAIRIMGVLFAALVVMTVWFYVYTSDSWHSLVTNSVLVETLLWIVAWLPLLGAAALLGRWAKAGGAGANAVCGRLLEGAEVSAFGLSIAMLFIPEMLDYDPSLGLVRGMLMDILLFVVLAVLSYGMLALTEQIYRRISGFGTKQKK